MTELKKLIYFIRLRQWYKNIIIFLPIVFTFQLFDVEKFFITFVGFIALSLTSSSMYVRNDIIDLDEDKINPLKKLRALPSGILTVKKAWLVFLVLSSMGFIMGFFLDRVFGIMLVLLMINTEIYSRWTKKIIFLDAFAIGLNFVIRAVSGIILLNVPLSPWLISGVFFVALFLTFLKRKGEIEFLKKANNLITNQKKYTISSLNLALTATAIIVILTYTLYSFNGPNNDWRLILTIPIIVFIIFRQIRLLKINVSVSSRNEFFKDKQSLLAIIAYTFFTIFLIYSVPSEFFDALF